MIIRFLLFSKKLLLCRPGMKTKLTGFIFATYTLKIRSAHDTCWTK